MKTKITIRQPGKKEHVFEQDLTQDPVVVYIDPDAGLRDDSRERIERRVKRHGLAAIRTFRAAEANRVPAEPAEAAPAPRKRATAKKQAAKKTAKNTTTKKAAAKKG